MSNLNAKMVQSHRQGHLVCRQSRQICQNRQNHRQGRCQCQGHCRQGRCRHGRCCRRVRHHRHHRHGRYRQGCCHRYVRCRY